MWIICSFQFWCCFFLVYLTTVHCRLLTIRDFKPRIVGGLPGLVTEFPYQVSLRLKVQNEHFCGGFLTSERHILTAAHCIEDLPVRIKLIAVVGSELLDGMDAVRRDVIRIEPHPHYRRTSMENDIALLEVRTPFPLSPVIAIAPLRRSPLKVDTKCIVSGFGVTNSSAEEVSNRLMYTEVSIKPRILCYLMYRYYNLIIRSSMICAGSTLGFHDSCQGDSGGPLLCDGEISGIVSFGLECGRTLVPGVYTDVRRFLTWIEETMYVSSRRNNRTTIYIRPKYKAQNLGIDYSPNGSNSIPFDSIVAPNAEKSSVHITNGNCLIVLVTILVLGYM